MGRGAVCVRGGVLALLYLCPTQVPAYLGRLALDRPWRKKKPLEKGPLLGSSAAREALCLDRVFQRDPVCQFYTVAAPFLVQWNSRVNGGAFPLPTIRLETFGLVLPEVEITTTELAKKSRRDLGRCHPKEIEFRTHATNGFRLASSLKAMPQQSNTS
jgi:hypothetical protein